MIRKYISALFLLSFFILPAFSFAEQADIDPNGSDSSCAVITQNLRYRMRDSGTDNNVSILQTYLYESGKLSIKPDGVFGKSTLSAVKKFQTEIGLSPTGYVGALTRAKIKELDCESGVVVNNNTPSIKVLSPNGGEAYQPGQNITVKWTTQNIPANGKIGIILQSNGGSRQPLITNSNHSTINDGVEIVTLPSASSMSSDGLAFGLNFKIEVGYDLGNSNHDSVTDSSDNLFAINNDDLSIPSNWQTYTDMTDNQHSFSFKYPLGMKVSKSNVINRDGSIMSTLYDIRNSSNQSAYPNMSIEYHVAPYGLQLYNADLTSPTQHMGAVVPSQVAGRSAIRYNYIMSIDAKGNTYNPPLNITNVNLLDSQGTGSFFMSFKTTASSDISILNKILSSFTN